MTSRLSTIGLALAFSLAACSSSSPSATTQADTGTTAETAAPCADPSDDPAATCVVSVNGALTDLAGAAVPDLVVSVCSDTCYYGKSFADGTFNTLVGANINTTLYSVLAHGRPDYASLYEPMPVGAMGTVTASALKLPKYEGGPALPADNAAASKVTQGDVTLVVPDGTAWSLDVEDVELMDKGRQLRVGTANIADLPTFAKGSGVVQLYGLAPFNALAVTYATMNNPMPTGQKVGVSLANKAMLAPGTVVEFVTMGTNISSQPPTAGKLIVSATGTVSADGKTIDTDAGQGIITISWIGVRPKAM